MTENFVSPLSAVFQNRPFNLKQKVKQGLLLTRFVKWLRAEDKDKLTQTIRKGIGIGLSIILCITVVAVPLVAYGIKEWKRQSNPTSSVKQTRKKIEQCTTNSFSQPSLAPNAKNLDGTSPKSKASNHLWFESKLTKMAFEAARKIEDPFYRALALCRYAKIDPLFDIDEILTIANQLKDKIDRMDILCLRANIQIRRNQYDDVLDFIEESIRISNEFDYEKFKPNLVLVAIKVAALYEISDAINIANNYTNNPQLFSMAAYKISKVSAEINQDFEYAVTLSRHIEIPLHRVKALCSIAKAQIKSSYENAVDTISEALDVAKCLEDDDEISQARSQIAEVQALINTDLALDTCLEIWDRDLRIQTLAKIGKIIKPKDPKHSIKIHKRLVRIIDRYGFDKSLQFEPLCEKAKGLMQSDHKRAKRALTSAEEIADGFPQADQKAFHLVEIAKVKALVSPSDERIVLNKIIKLLNEIFVPRDKFSAILNILQKNRAS